MITTERYVGAIREQSRSLARCAADALDREVSHCPGWTVEDLVAHLVEVHWFWATIVEGRLAAPPPSGRPARPARGRLIAPFRGGAARRAAGRAGAGRAGPVYTWAPSQHDVAFVSRHQVQEVAVHHWDVADAAGRAAGLDGELAADAVDEFLTVSLSTEADPAEPPRPALDGALALVATDTGRAWTVRDARPGTVRVEAGATTEATLAAPAFDLLLWLYGRVELDATAPVASIGQRLRALAFTD